LCSVRLAGGSSHLALHFKSLMPETTLPLMDTRDDSHLLLRMK
jgi:hypothetical protein